MKIPRYELVIRRDGDWWRVDLQLEDGRLVTAYAALPVTEGNTIVIGTQNVPIVDYIKLKTT